MFPRHVTIEFSIKTFRKPCKLLQDSSRKILWQICESCAWFYGKERQKTEKTSRLLTNISDYLNDDSDGKRVCNILGTVSGQTFFHSSSDIKLNGTHFSSSGHFFKTRVLKVKIIKRLGQISRYFRPRFVRSKKSRTILLIYLITDRPDDNLVTG